MNTYVNAHMYVLMKVKVQSLSCVQLFVTPWAIVLRVTKSQT